MTEAIADVKDEERALDETQVIAPVDGGSGVPATPAAGPRTQPPPPAPAAWTLAGAVLAIVALVTLGFASDVTFLGTLRHMRAQQTEYSSFRSDLANAVAPTGDSDQNGQLLPLGAPVAVLTIPQLDLQEVVGEGTTSGVTMSGPGHRRDTPLPGQAGTSVIVGRRATFGGPFRYLDTLVKGQVFTVTTGQGVHTYRVLDVRHAGDPVPATITEGHGRLTLMTADGSPYQPADLIRVDAEQLTPIQPSGSHRILVSNLPRSELAMAGDPGAWIILVLWGEALTALAVAITWMRSRWGRWQSWLVGMPALVAIGLHLADDVARLLPNVM